MRRTFQVLLLAVALCGGCFRLIAAGQAEHVVILVWDGLRPDFVRPQYTPTLHELAKRGTFFRNHHSSYITSTEVNGAVLATGMHPEHSGILANVQYRPELSWQTSYGTENLDAIRRGDLLWDGHYLEAATLPEILQQAGIPTITAGAKPVVLLHDRMARKDSPAQKDSVTLFRGRTLPRSLIHSLTNTPGVGPFPDQTSAPDSTQEWILYGLRKGRDRVNTWLHGKSKEPSMPRLIDSWTTRALVHGLWNKGIPKYTLLWLSEPDASQHESGVGSESAQAAMSLCDDNLALVIQALKDQGVLQKTDIIVVSDHGFSTIDRGPELIKPLKRAGFVAGKQFDNPEPGDVMVINLGGSVAFYVFDHHQPTIHRLVEFLQGGDFAGVIFSAVDIEGTFPLSKVRLGSPQGAPDVLISMNWSPDRNDWGAPGLIASMEGKRGRGTHASLSPFDLHNTLVMAGPDFKQGYVSDLPSGNVDLVPTILDILGVPPPQPRDGRVLSEAFVSTPPATLQPEPEMLETSRNLGFHIWHQFLKMTRVGSVVYYDEGNGQARLK